MSDLIVVAYPDQFRAAEVRATLTRLQTEYLLDLEDACVVTKDDAGKVKLHQTVNLTAEGALSGVLWGSLIGMLFLNPLLGGLVGVGAGALGGAVSDFGINDDFIRELAAQMQPNSSAIFVLARKVTPDKVLAELAKFGGTILRTSLPQDAEARWQQALSSSTAASSGMLATPVAATMPPVENPIAPSANPAESV